MRASAISSDGQVIGGVAQGSFDRTPGTWSASNLTGSLYDISQIGEVHGLNNDGSTVLLKWNGAAARDDASGFTVLGKLNSGLQWSSIPTDVSEDGQTIVGFDVNSLARQAWMWTTASGFQAMDQVLADAGFVNAPTTFVCRAMSDDGNVIVGGNVAGGGGPFGFGAFIFERSSVDIWEDKGHALAGTNGLPNLVGSGSLQPGKVVTLSLSNAVASGSTYLIMGFSQVDAAFKGGVLVPAPDLVRGPWALDASGGLHLATHWPGGVPSGFISYFQYWTPDAGGPVGFSASNGLAATAP